MRKLAFSLLTLSLIAGLTTACGSSSKDEISNAQPTAAETSSNQQQEPVNLVFTYNGGPIEKTVMENSIAEFMKKYPNIKVDAQFVATDYTTKITTMVAGNTAPDIGYLPADIALAWAEEGKLANVMDFLKDDPELKREAFLPNIWYDWAPGKSLGTSTAAEAFTLFYNKNLTDTAGITVPTTADTAWTWDQFVENARKLTIDKKGHNALDAAFDPNNIKQYGVQFGTWWGSYMNMVYSNGGAYLNDDGTEFKLNSPESAEAIQKIADLINVYHVMPSPVQASSLPGMATAMQTNQVAMFIDGQWSLLDVDAAKVPFGIGVLPKMKKSVTLMVGDPTVIFNSTKHPKEAWLLYKWLANPETSLELHKGGLWMPLLKDWYEKPELIAKWAENNSAHPEGYKDAVVNQAMKNGIPGLAYTVRNFPTIDSIVTPALDKVWMGESKAQDVLNEIAPKVQAELKGIAGK
ncbi:ABC transporter substrate-binding protein [Paenibacillus albus]|uniref:Sugar ABC transporter substrate-binding protein n=1 Tax=Paenibacillus albus TaxID=2495582 RepID=A0A3S9ABN4_9BACL|nr:sugar ABC transporter substrate-binding protein [Paenibacillus albus]AZN43120.1 sugar ABC transporter substrate-binding protein [Paenibacillus albus]